MKKILVLMFVLLAHTATADVMLTFKDKTSHVWESYYEKGGQYCTHKSFGEYCIAKKDVISIKNVPPGTEASEYSVSSLGSEAPKNLDTSKALQSLNCTQLRASTSDTAKEQYRNECMTRAEQDAWDAQQERKASLHRAEHEKEQAAAADEARKKQAAMEQKRYEDSMQRRYRP